MNAQKLLRALSLPNAKRLTTKMPTAKNAASQYSEVFALRNQASPLTPKITIVGTMTRLETMLDVSRVVHSTQYSRPSPVRTTPAASKNDVASAGTRTPIAKKTT